MDVTMKAKTVGTSAGAGIGLFSAAAVADDLATVSMHALSLDPATPPEVVSAWTRLITMAYGLLITAAVAAVGRILSPAGDGLPAKPAAPPTPVLPSTEKETDHAKIVPGA